MKATRITVSLTPELREYVEAQVRSGLYRDKDEVVRDALRHLEATRDQPEDPELEKLVDAGLRGPFTPLTFKTYQRVRARSRELQRRLARKRPAAVPANA